MRAIRHVPVVLVALGTVACTALLGDFNVGGAGSSGGPGDEAGADGGAGEAGALGIMPTEAKVGTLRALAFTATVPVTWAVMEGAGAGAIDDTGKFVASDKPGVVHVVATSKSDPTLTASATVTVAPVGISILTGVNGGEGNIDGPPARAHFKQPSGIAHLFDNGGLERYFIVDAGNSTIRLYDTSSQKVTTIAGEVGVVGKSDGVGIAAHFNQPSQVVANRKTNTLYIVDGQGSCIRELDPATNKVTTLAGQCGSFGNGDGGGGVLASFGNIDSIDTNGGKFNSEDVTALFVCDQGQRIRKVFTTGASKGAATTLINGTSSCRLATDQFSGGQPAKTVYFLDSNTQTLKRFTDTPPYAATVVAPAPDNFTNGIAIASGQGPDGLYMLSGNHSVVYRLAPLGAAAFDTAPYVGVVDDARVIDGPFATASAGSPRGIDVITEHGAGSVLIADNAAAAIRSADLGTKKLTTFIGAARMIDRIDGPRSTARLTGPFSITSDSTGTIFFTDVAFDGNVLNNTIRKVDSTGVVTTVAGKPQRPNPTVTPLDGTKDEATFGFPVDIVSLKGNLYVVDSFGQAVRKITATGDVTTLAGQLGLAGDTTDAIGGAAHFKFSDNSSSGGGQFGGGIATDGTDLYVCDSANFAIRKITLATGQVTLLAGGTTGTANGIGPIAQFLNPFGLAYDNGFLYIADNGDHTIRRLDLKTNEVTSFMGFSGQFGDVDGDAGTALFRSPARIQSDGIGNLFVAELPFKDGSFPGLIRRIDIKARKAIPYGGALGKLGLATGALPSTVNCPLSFTVLPTGDLAFTDFCEASIALIKPL